MRQRRGLHLFHVKESVYADGLMEWVKCKSSTRRCVDAHATQKLSRCRRQRTLNRWQEGSCRGCETSSERHCKYFEGEVASVDGGDVVKPSFRGPASEQRGAGPTNVEGKKKDEHTDL